MVAVVSVPLKALALGFVACVLVFGSGLDILRRLGFFDRLARSRNFEVKWDNPIVLCNFLLLSKDCAGLRDFFPVLCKYCGGLRVLDLVLWKRGGGLRDFFPVLGKYCGLLVGFSSTCANAAPSVATFSLS